LLSIKRANWKRRVGKFTSPTRLAVDLRRRILIGFYRLPGSQQRSLFVTAYRPQELWVEPSLLAEIEYRVKSAEGKVRHPFFKGIREDL